MESYFVFLLQKLANLDQIKDYVHKDHDWSFKYGFDIIECPRFLIESNSELITLLDNFEGKAHFLKLDSWKLYNLHIDIPRNISINSVITGFDAFTFFTDHIPNLEEEAFSSINELTYTEGDIVLLNVSKPHGVYNRSQTRIILSLSFPTRLNYDTMFGYLNNNNLLR